MYYLSYFSGVAKAAMLLMGLNGSADKINLHDAYAFIDNRVHSIEAQDLIVDNDLIVRAKKEILGMSYQDETLASIVKKVADNLEQRVLFGFPNEIIELPEPLLELGRIYHFKVSQQMDGFSCGYWSIANAKMLDTLIVQGGLDLQSLNVHSNRMVQRLLGERTQLLREDPMLLPQNIDNITVYGNINKHVDQYCKLNKKLFSSLARACDVKNDEDLVSAFKAVAMNKLHVVRRLDDDLSPCYISNNMAVEGDQSNVVEVVVNALMAADDPGRVIANIVDEFLIAAQQVKVLDAEALQKQMPLLTAFNRTYIEELGCMNHLEDGQVESFLLAYYPQLISLEKLQENVPKLDGISEEFAYFSDYSNNKLLTLINLKAAVIGYTNFKHISNLGNQGSISGPVYLKGLSNHFKAMVGQNQNCAMHFACHTGIHWLVISVINLADKGSVLAILDSTNYPITMDFDLPEGLVLNDLSFLNEIEDRETGCKLFYILYLYNLFIRGNAEGLDSRIDEWRELKRAEDGYEYGLDDGAEDYSAEDQRLIEMAMQQSLLSVHKNGKNGKNGTDHKSPAQISFLLDACPGEKGKEKEKVHDPLENDEPEKPLTKKNGFHPMLPPTDYDRGEDGDNGDEAGEKPV